MSTIKEYYNYSYDEWGRLERHRIEFEITKKAMDQYIGKKSEVLDVGGGPGRYSIYLAQQGHSVTLFDLAENLVRQAEENARKAGADIRQFITGNVLELGSVLPDKYYDAVLCMGPMYHLLEENERTAAIRQCMDRLRPGGIIIASFISAYAPILDWMKKWPREICNVKESLLGFLNDGRAYENKGFTDAYFEHPAKIRPFFDNLGIETIKLMAAEGIGIHCEESLQSLPEEDFMEWIDLFYRIADREEILGSSMHLLYIGRKH
ncbi:MAG TPA: class I SAM-dependent methyltransferase [Clostridia bacterium]|nr:class I SAM-dependent methyltransferase [Clostridia bacterium]